VPVSVSGAGVVIVPGEAESLAGVIGHVQACRDAFKTSKATTWRER
jgi:hypothetical protein